MAKHCPYQLSIPVKSEQQTLLIEINLNVLALNHYQFPLIKEKNNCAADSNKG